MEKATTISNPSKSPISAKEQRKLHAKSGNRCAKCKQVLVDPLSIDSPCLGENAHIYGERPGSARYDASLEIAFVNSEANLIFLCCNCHKQVDTDIVNHPPEQLLLLKTDHENWVIQALSESSATYTFAELEVLTSYLLNNSLTVHTTDDFTITKIGDKIKKNSLASVQSYINMGLTSILTIEDYLNRNPDQEFSVRLASVMVNEYKRLKDLGFGAVDIFHALWDMACGKQTDFRYKAAGLGIVVFFFEKCEVFEK